MTADIVLFSAPCQIWHVLLIERKKDPFKGAWALPGGFLENGEGLAECALRELREETSMRNVELSEVGVFDEVNRDPRGRTISVAFTGHVEPSRMNFARAQDDAASVKWFVLDKLPDLAFDHKQIIGAALKHCCKYLDVRDYGVLISTESWL
jgi:8-oxo-dGTP diphosphatase